jgi:hypothetical protein
MSSESANSTFDDPSFRKALRTQLGKESAPPSLRARVLVALDEAEGSTPASLPITTRRPLFRRPLVGLALAASILIVIGIGVTIMLQSGGTLNRPVATLPKPFLEAMAQQHDTCETSDRHQAANQDLAATTKQLRDELGFQPLVTAIEGWQIQGANVCPIDTVKAAHVLYTRGDQSISLFSFPGRAVYTPQDGARYAVTIDNHPIAGFVKGTTVYCIVGKSAKDDLTLTEVQAIVDSLEKRM